MLSPKLQHYFQIIIKMEEKTSEKSVQVTNNLHVTGQIVRKMTPIMQLQLAASKT